MRLLLVSVLLSAAAHADPPRYTRKHELTIEVRPTSRTRPIQPKATAGMPKLGADDLMMLADRAQPILVEQEAMLEQLARDTPDSDPQKPEVLFRLAEHYAAQLRVWHLKSIGLELRAR